MFLRSKTNGSWTSWVEYAKTDHPNLINTDWVSAGFSGTYYKRVGDVLTIKYNFRGNGSTMNIGTIPSSVWSPPQSYMLIIAKWSIDGAANSHVQINQGSGGLNVLSTGNGTEYKGQLTIMI
ncbi:prophage LambdaSa1, minor structural protein [Streptococcus pseudoporcinus]|nr:prophage LambdaSa1, minor structural protein [Streptococcus pseudoporcinus]